MDILLLVFANNSENPLPTLTYEYSAIKRILSPRSGQEHFMVFDINNARLDDINYYINLYRDQLCLFLFSGHAGRDHLLAEDNTGRSEGIAHLLSQCPRLKVVILNGCSTDGQVAALHKAGIPIVIATSAPIGDNLASRFSIALFQGLAFGRTIADAFEQAIGETLTHRHIKHERGLALREFQPDQHEIWRLSIAPGQPEIENWKLPDLPISNDGYNNQPKLQISPSLPLQKPDIYLPRKIKKTSKGNSPGASGLYDSQELLAELEFSTRIVLLADAGMGKSTELAWFAYSLMGNSKYIPIYKRLSAYNKKDFIDSLRNLSPDVQKRIILILDGLDEVDISSAKNIIDSFSESHPELKILVSCRANAYSNTLVSFQEHYLNELSYADIKAFIENRLGASGEEFLTFWSRRNPWNPTQLINNPFYLIRICQYIEENGNNPPDSLSNLFEHLIEKALDIRLQKISRFDDEKLRKSCRTALEKLAFVMECRGENTIGQYELEELISGEDERYVLLAKSSLIEFETNNWRFAHNNFQEYLAAKVLSKAKSFSQVQKAIGRRPKYNNFKWTWLNTVSFLLGVLNDNNPIKSHLFQWLANNDLDALIKIASFEHDNIALPIRENIFRQAFIAAKKHDLIVGFKHYHYWDLAELGDSANSIRFLYEELKQPATLTVLNNALVLLANMKPAFIPDDIKAPMRSKLLELISAFRGSNNRASSAMDALFNLYDDFDTDEAIQLVAAFFDSKNAEERTSIYRFISKKNLQALFMERLIERADQLESDDWRKEEVHLIDEDWQMEACFKDITKEEVIILFFQAYTSTIEKSWRYDSKVLKIMLAKATEIKLTQNGARSVFDSMKDTFNDRLLYSNTFKDLITKFLDLYGFTDLFFQFLVNEGRSINTAIAFLREPGVKYLVSRYEQGLIQRGEMEKYILWAFHYRNIYLNMLIAQLNQVADQPFLMPERPVEIDQREKNKELLVLERDLLFNKESYAAYLKEIFSLLGDKKMSKGEIFRLKYESNNETIRLFQRYPSSMLHVIDDNVDMSQTELLQAIEKNWDWFSLNQLKNYFNINRDQFEGKLDQYLNPDQVSSIRIWCENYLPKLLIAEHQTRGDILFAWYTIKLQYYDFPKDVYLKLLDSELINYSIDLNFLSFCVDFNIIPFSAIKHHVITSLQSGKVENYKLYVYLKFVEEKNLIEALPLLPNYFHNGALDISYSTEALNVFIKLNGDKNVLRLLLEDFNVSDRREDIVLEYYLKNPDGFLEDILIQKLSSAQQIEKQLKYANHLFWLGNKQGLRFLLNYIKNERKSPFFIHNESPSIKFENLDAVPLLLDLIHYGSDQGIKQDAFSRIPNVGKNILLHLATKDEGKHFKKITQAIQRHLFLHTFLNKLPNWLKRPLHVRSLEGLKEIRYLLRDIEFQFYRNETIELETALEIWKGFNR